MSSNSEEKKVLRSVGRAIKEVAPYSGLGLQLVITIFMFLFVGKLIDEHYGTSPVWMITGSIVGIAIGMYNFIMSVLELIKKRRERNGN